MELNILILQILISNFSLPHRAMILITNIKKAALKMLLIGGGEKI